jgi:hypothetical protein
MERSYAELPNGVVGAANGISYAYRDTGGHDGAAPVVDAIAFVTALGLGQVDLLGERPACTAGRPP